MSHTSDLGQSAKDHAADIAEQAKTAAQDKAAEQASFAKHHVADGAQRAADAADAAASQFPPNSPQAQAMQQVADHIESVALRLRHADVQELASRATDVARRHPMLTIGGAALAGFAAARFLKARDPRRPVAYTADPWAAPATAYPDHAAATAINGGGRDV